MININTNQVFLLNSLAVPCLGNVQQRFHFLRRGTSGDIAEFEGFATKAYTTANGFTPPVGSNVYMRICDNSVAAGQIYFPTPFISNEGDRINTNKGNIQVATQDNGLLVSSKDISTIESIQLFDITGRLLISNKEIKNISTQVPLDGIKRGTYILKVLNTNGELFSTKVIY